jgi:putative transposase
MMWTEITRSQYRREGLRYSSNMMEAEWLLLEPLLPGMARLGRPRTVDQRSV